MDDKIQRDFRTFKSRREPGSPWNDGPQCGSCVCACVRVCTCVRYVHAEEKEEGGITASRWMDARWTQDESFDSTSHRRSVWRGSRTGR